MSQNVSRVSHIICFPIHTLTDAVSSLWKRIGTLLKSIFKKEKSEVPPLNPNRFKHSNLKPVKQRILREGEIVADPKKIQAAKDKILSAKKDLVPANLPVHQYIDNCRSSENKPFTEEQKAKQARVIAWVKKKKESSLSQEVRNHVAPSEEKVALTKAKIKQGIDNPIYLPNPYRREPLSDKEKAKQAEVVAWVKKKQQVYVPLEETYARLEPLNVKITSTKKKIKEAKDNSTVATTPAHNFIHNLREYDYYSHPKPEPLTPDQQAKKEKVTKWLNNKVEEYHRDFDRAYEEERKPRPYSKDKHNTVIAKINKARSTPLVSKETPRLPFNPAKKDRVAHIVQSAQHFGQIPSSEAFDFTSYNRETPKLRDLQSLITQEITLRFAEDSVPAADKEKAALTYLASQISKLKAPAKDLEDFKPLPDEAQLKIALNKLMKEEYEPLKQDIKKLIEFHNILYTAKSQTKSADPIKRAHAVQKIDTYLLPYISKLTSLGANPLFLSI